MAEETHILVVDDDPRVRGLLCDYLEDEGYKLTGAADGDAMRACFAEVPVNLVILDLNLPGEDGLTLARELGATSEVPIIIVTGKGDVIDRVTGLEVGADDYIAKPFELREVCEGCTADLKRIRNPLVIFASYGDNITPPHQALGWIPAVYKDTDDLKQAGQRIVYLTNPHVGHLGIFVSAKVARFEHRAILESLDEIEALAPGLYEMKIDNPSGDPDCHKPQYAVRFEERKVEDLDFAHQSEAFERVRAVSEANESLYRTFVSPWVQAAANPWSAEWMKWMHPMRTSRYLFSEDFNPWMRGVAILAETVAKNRTPLPEDHPLVEKERELIAQVSDAMENAREARDSAHEQTFGLLYGGANLSDASRPGSS